MKELSIQEKSQLYDVESEDEKIRKEMIFYFTEEIHQCSIKEHADKMKEFISWLEKQCEKDKLIQELGEYKVKYIQEILEKVLALKTNKAPEKIQIHFIKNDYDDWNVRGYSFLEDNQIGMTEYTRTDAFIEKEENWLINNTDITSTGIKNFCKAMKKE